MIYVDDCYRLSPVTIYEQELERLRSAPSPPQQPLQNGRPRFGPSGASSQPYPTVRPRVGPSGASSQPYPAVRPRSSPSASQPLSSTSSSPLPTSAPPTWRGKDPIPPGDRRRSTTSDELQGAFKSCRTNGKRFS